jgi:CheY-like chemotaxis protein
MDSELWLRRIGQTKGSSLSQVFPSLEDRTSFSITEVARVFGVTVQAVHQWVQTGKLGRVTRASENGQYRISRGEFVRLLRESGRTVPGLWEDSRAKATKVLFIDDNAQIRRLIEDIGRSPRMLLSIKTAPNVEDGIVLAAHFLPDVIFLDYYFAADRLRGDEALAFIRKAKAIRRTKVVGVSNDPQIGKKMLAAGADGFLRKPFGVAEFSWTFALFRPVR